MNFENLKVINVENLKFIRKIVYDKVFCHLFITFSSGKVYRYIAFPESLYIELENTVKENFGTSNLFHNKIKNSFHYDIVN